MKELGIKKEVIVGYGKDGITGPTTPAVDGPICDEKRKFQIVTMDMETAGIFPLPESNNKKEMEGRAELFADAMNTAQKCGLLPSELLRQRDELLITLIDIRNKLYLSEKSANLCFEIAEAAIKSTER